MHACTKVKRLLSRYLDAEATLADAALVEKHLTVCSLCRQELAALRQVQETVWRKERKTLPPDYLVCRLREKIFREEDAPGKLSWLTGMGEIARRLIPVPVAAVALSLLLLILNSQAPTTGGFSLEEQALDGTQTTLSQTIGLILGEEI